jgi:hypothetical protein
MPSLKSRAVPLGDNYVRTTPIEQPPAAPTPAPPPPSVIPNNLQASSIMITSLPAISTTLDGGVRELSRAQPTEAACELARVTAKGEAQCQKQQRLTWWLLPQMFAP